MSIIRNTAAAVAGGASVLVVPYSWVVMASAAYCEGVGLPDRFVFPYTQWLDVAPYWQANWWTALWVGISAAAPSAAMLVAAYIVVRVWFSRTRRRLNAPMTGGLKPTERGVTDNHGHADWPTPADLVRDFGNTRGCLIGAATRGGRLLFDDTREGPTHSLQIAGPGSFKTTAAVTRLWHWIGPRVAFDPSLEIGPIMTKALEAEGFRVVTIGLNGSGINALDWIDIRHPESDTHIRNVVRWIYDEGATTPSGQGHHRDPFWPTWGRALVTCLLAHLMHSAPAGLAPTLKALRRGIATPEADMQNLLTYIHNMSDSRMAAELAGGLMGMKAAQTFSGIYGNAFSATEWLSVEAYADAVSGDAMRTADILDSNTVVFVHLPVRSLLATPAIGRAVMGALFNAMFHADSGQGDRILFQIDEAWLLGAMPEIELCHSTARKYRGTLCTIWQSEGQIEKTWGAAGAKLLRDTVSWRSYNAVGDGDVADKLSRDLGEHGVLAYSEGDNSGQQKPFGLALPSSSRGSNVNTHEIKRRLIKGDEILRAAADEMFVLKRDYPHPIRCFSAPYFNYPDLASRMGANRFRSAA